MLTSLPCYSIIIMVKLRQAWKVNCGMNPWWLSWKCCEMWFLNWPNDQYSNVRNTRNVQAGLARRVNRQWNPSIDTAPKLFPRTQFSLSLISQRSQFLAPNIPICQDQFIGGRSPQCLQCLRWMVRSWPCCSIVRTSHQLSGGVFSYKCCQTPKPQTTSSNAPPPLTPLL